MKSISKLSMFEPPPVSWRLYSLRGWSDDKAQQVPTGAARVSDAYGGGAPWGAPLEWAAMGSIASKGMTAETLRIWVRWAEVDGGEAPGVKRGEVRIRELERENRELRR